MGEGYSFGCRDFLSEKVLHLNGIKNTIMTGCAAWYDLDYINDLEIKNSDKISSICVSDPANPFLYQQLYDLCCFLSETFPNAKLQVVFHRGIKADQFTSEIVGAKLKVLCDKLCKGGINYCDISYSHEGMEIYDTCDLHIGFRVHAHIYNLSHRHRSLLIEEDSRGAGVNDALGLPRIRAYDLTKNIQNTFFRKVNNHIHYKSNISDYICPELRYQLDNILNHDCIQYKWVFIRMQFYYENMIRHLTQIVQN